MKNKNLLIINKAFQNKNYKNNKYLLFIFMGYNLIYLF